MSKHPLTLTLVFLLELAMLAAYVYWGWTQHTDLLRFVLAIGVPVAAAAIWGVFRVPGEPKDAPVPVVGWVRLLIEWTLFGLAAVLLAMSGAQTAAGVFAALVIIYYSLAYDRVLRFLRRG